MLFSKEKLLLNSMWKLKRTRELLQFWEISKNSRDQRYKVISSWKLGNKWINRDLKQISD